MEEVLQEKQREREKESTRERERERERGRGRERERERGRERKLEHDFKIPLWLFISYFYSHKFCLLPIEDCSQSWTAMWNVECKYTTSHCFIIIPFLYFLD